MKRRDPNGPRLVEVSCVADKHNLLWKLLEERPPEANISHVAMPDWKEHCSFVNRYPYRRWYFIEHHGAYVGAVHLTRRYEIGVAIFKEFQRNGYAEWGVKEMVRMWGHKVPYYPAVTRKAILANVAPTNEASKRFFEKQGFKHVANVYALDIE